MRSLTTIYKYEEISAYLNEKSRHLKYAFSLMNEEERGAVRPAWGNHPQTSLD